MVSTLNYYKYLDKFQNIHKTIGDDHHEPLKQQFSLTKLINQSHCLISIIHLYLFM